MLFCQSNPDPWRSSCPDWVCHYAICWARLDGMPDLTFPSGPDELRAYLAVPEGDGPRPGVVVLHEAWGLNDDIRAQADRFAAEGYVAFAPDLYSAGPRLRCIRKTF